MFAMCSWQVSPLQRQYAELSEPLAVLTMDFEPQARHLYEFMQHLV